jgi:hypothetical protein
VEALVRHNCAGWFVAEQDTLRKGRVADAAAGEDQQRNRAFLKERGVKGDRSGLC